MLEYKASFFSPTQTTTLRGYTQQSLGKRWFGTPACFAFEGPASRVPLCEAVSAGLHLPCQGTLPGGYCLLVLAPLHHLGILVQDRTSDLYCDPNVAPVFSFICFSGENLTSFCVICCTYTLFEREESNNLNRFLLLAES